jgi:hypothetical protein
MAAILVDGGLAQRGVGAYMLWNDLLYSELDIYKGRDAGTLKTIGQVADDGNQTTDLVRYGRLALIEGWGSHHAGAYALTGSVLPGGNQTFGFNNRVIDAAVDANYQFIYDPTRVTSDMLSARATISTRTAASLQARRSRCSGRFVIRWIRCASTSPTAWRPPSRLRFSIFGPPARPTPATGAARPEAKLGWHDLRSRLRALGQAGFAISEHEPAAGRALRQLFHIRRRFRECS